MMKIVELRKKSKKELRKLSQDLREKLRVLRFDLVAGKVKNVREVRAVKKDIARILTILNELEADHSVLGGSKRKKVREKYA